jgi:hypothetical protein
MTTMTKPLGLTDQQLRLVTRAAQAIRQRDGDSDSP